ncbi:putative actin patch protein [Rosellinia necatrix]|uniref:Putative actin patch protein n=1 Tax=Rosellinia necatrix TaxID=77044 RepID=A0A1S8A7P3_ROSNE|nr:putative actin patch protein [Rosellinia necatrix]
MLCTTRGRPAEKQPPGVIDESCPLLAAPLALEYISIYPALDAMLVVGQSVEVEANEAFTIPTAEAGREEESSKVQSVAGVGTLEEAARGRQRGRRCPKPAT